jgi:uridine kinase
MKEMITIRCMNNGGKLYEVEAGSTLSEICQIVKPQLKGEALVTHVNNRVVGLPTRIYNNVDVRYLDVTHPSGKRTYIRSLFFVMRLALERLFPEVGEFVMEAPVSGGYFCDLKLDHRVTDNDVEAIKAEMRSIIDADLPFLRVKTPTEDAIKVFEKEGMMSKVKLLNTYNSLYTTYFTLDGFPDFYYGALVEHTGQLHLFDLMRMDHGVLLRVPDSENPTQLRPLVKQEKMFEVFRTHREWQDIIGLRTIDDLNDINSKGYATDLINVSEALQEKKVCHIAEEIANRPQVKLVLIAGPSSSGKPTFSRRLSVQLAACGIWPMPISMDDYVVDRELTPRDEKGEYDFESVDALNLPLLQQHLQALFDGEEVELPRYNFHTGKSEKSGQRLKITRRTVIVMEGIHALNPKLTESISDLLKYKVYVSALTTILLDNHNYIPTTDNRLLRRIIRDHKYRSYSAYDTIHRWPSVRAGENKWIFPFQENADAMFNSALLFELACLRDQALALLEMVPENVTEHAEAVRLRKFLHYIRPIQIDQIPPMSLLREFLGGSIFRI